MRKTSSLWYLAILFLAVRLVYPLLFLPIVEHFDYGEEQCRGTLAFDLIHGLKIPFFEYAADVYSGGSLVIGILATPFFLLLGPSLFALHCVPVCFGLGTMLGWYFLIARYFNRTAGIITALLFVLPPPYYLRISSYAEGYHPDAALFAILGFLCLFRILHGGTERGLLSAACLGLVWGFGVWFINTTMLCVAVGMAWWFLHDRKLLVRRQFWMFVLFFALGLLPWIPHNLTYNFQALEFLRGGLQYNYFGSFPATLSRFAAIVRTTLPSLFIVDIFEFDRQKYWNVICCAICVLALGGLLVRGWKERQRGGGLPMTLFPLFAFCSYVVMVSLTRFRPAPFLHIYFLPALPFLFASIGLYIGSLWENGLKSRIAASALLMLWYLPLAVGFYYLLSFEFPGGSFRIPGYSYSGLAGTLYDRFHLQVDRLTPVIAALENKLPDEEARAFSHQLVMARAEFVPLKEDVPSLCGLVPYLRHEDRMLLCFRLGISIDTLWADSQTRIERQIEDALGKGSMSWVRSGEQLSRAYKKIFGAGIGDSVNRVPVGNPDDGQICFLDDTAYPNDDGGFWIRGKCTANYLYRSPQPLASLDVSLENGLRPNHVCVRVGHQIRTCFLLAGAKTRELVPLQAGIPFEGMYYWPISIENREGFIPSLVSESRDSRFLGIKISIEPVTSR